MRPGAGDRRPGAAAVLAAVSVLMAVPVLARDHPGIEIRDLYYGEALFHFYQQDDLTTLNHLLVARSLGRLRHHEADADLLIGGLYLSYGLHEKAAQIFTRLLDDNADPAVRDRAWFYLGKVRYQRGLYADAEQAFGHVGDDLPDRLAAEFRLLRAQSLMGMGQYDAVAGILDRWHGPDDWAAYARFNLGVAWIRAGRFADGVRALDRVGHISSSAPELRDLRDKANLALGYAWLQNEQPAAAREVLQRVRINGPFSNKALLGVGWADALQKEYRTALVPWLELRDRDLLDGAVQESLLAVPYAFDRLEARGSAVDSYRDALNAFDAEIGRLDAVMQRVRSGELVSSLMQQDSPGTGRWYWQLEQLPDSEDARYLYHLVANHDFQDGLRDYRDLVGLDQRLADWTRRLDALLDIVDTRQQAFEQRLPVVEAELDTVDLTQLHARRDQLAQRLDNIRQDRNVLGVATAAEQDQWRRLTALEQSPVWGLPQTSEARARQRVLKGLLLWDMDKDYRFRVWQQQRELAALDSALARADAATVQVEGARRKIPQSLEVYRNRINAIRPRLVAMRSTVTAALSGQQDHLQMLAVRELQQQRERLASYRVQARFALATIYDRTDATARNQEAGQ
ncbi:MAG TPA: tetratricopeptide repeat protein [Chromatiales bacterium]|nr:tetratricopeptide repeat protein [Chromatiales bacterium]